jgi:Ni/Co efflux regulator RcnB
MPGSFGRLGLASFEEKVMKVLLGTSLALVLLTAVPSFAGPADTVGSEGGEGMYSEGATPAPQAGGQNAQGERPSRADRRARREQRRAEREARGANGSERLSREERRAQRAERRAQHADRGDRGDRAERRANRGDRGDRANRGNKRQFAMGDRVPRKMLAGRRVVTDYARYGVQAPHGGDQWVRGRKQLLLVSADGVVKNVIVRQKRRHRDRGETLMPGQSDQTDQTVH